MKFQNCLLILAVLAYIPPSLSCGDLSGTLHGELESAASELDLNRLNAEQSYSVSDCGYQRYKLLSELFHNLPDQQAQVEAPTYLDFLDKLSSWIYQAWTDADGNGDVTTARLFAMDHCMVQSEYWDTAAPNQSHGSALLKQQIRKFIRFGSACQKAAGPYAKYYANTIEEYPTVLHSNSEAKELYLLAVTSCPAWDFVSGTNTHGNRNLAHALMQGECRAHTSEIAGIDFPDNYAYRVQGFSDLQERTQSISASFAAQ